MKKNIKFLIIGSILVLVVFLSCNQGKGNTDTILTGKINLLVDESLLPIIEDQVAVFENQYDAKITLLPKSEKEAMLSFSNKVADVIVLARDLNKEEITFFKNKKIEPRRTPFAIDAIALIKSKKTKDTIIALNDVIDYLKGSKNGIKGLVFDNPNSSTANYLCSLAGIKNLPAEGVYSFKTNEEVIKNISENEGMIGVVGINWLSQPRPEMKKYLEDITILSVKGSNKEYVYPSQEAIASREYPLARVLYLVNCQGYEGLGMGFASFIAGESGQRVIVQSGLAPMREPSRNIIIRNQIENGSK